MDWAGIGSGFCSLFVIWIAAASALALIYPRTFLWLSPAYFPVLMGLLMYSVGVTTGPSDFKGGHRWLRPLCINFVMCFVLMPGLALALAWAIGASREQLAGMVLLASVNGGQASNLCCLIAGADVPLSILMTVSTTFGGIVLTPLLLKTLLGAVIRVDSWGILRSTVQVVLFPVLMGVVSKATVPRLCDAMKPGIPVLGILVSIFVVGATVASCTPQILGASFTLHAALLLFHILGAGAGYLLPAWLGGHCVESRTVAIEVSMKSAAFAFVLAVLHFEDFDVRVPAAVDCIWCPLFAAALGAVWRAKSAGLEAGAWAAEYKPRW